MGDFAIPGYQPSEIQRPRGNDFKLPFTPPLLPPVIPPFNPLPLPDRETINKALRKGHEIIKDLFDAVRKPPYRYIVEGVAIAGAHALNSTAGLVVAGTVVAVEGKALLNKILNR